MTPTPLSGLWPDLVADLSDPGLLRQIATLALCLASGWGLARLVRAALSTQSVQLGAMRLGVQSFDRVLAPLLALTLIAGATPLLARSQHVNLLRMALPLVASFALIRLAFYVLRRVFARGGRAGSFLLIFEKVF